MRTAGDSDIVEITAIGMKRGNRGVYETPGGAYPLQGS